METAENPYESPANNSVVEPLADGRFYKRDILIACLPFVPILACYSHYVLASIWLGHWARPMLDDPKYISDTLVPFYQTTMLLLVAFPLFDLVSVIAPFTAMRANLPMERRGILALVAVANSVISFCILRWDPLFVLEWLMD
ncbi:MAG: hypothetical protein AAF483_24710 [Planctomycetota bacterium]